MALLKRSAFRIVAAQVSKNLQYCENKICVIANGAESDWGDHNHNEVAILH